MHIVVSENFAPGDTSTAEFMSAIAEEIARDRRVVVLSGTPGSSAQRDDCNLQVVEFSNWRPAKKSLTLRALAMTWFCLATFGFVLRRSTHLTPVIVVTAPFLLPYSTVLAAWIKRAPTALIVFDLYPDAIIAAGLITPNSLLARLVRRFNEWLYRALDVIVIIGRDMENHFAQYRAATAHKLEYIPNWATVSPRLRPIDQCHPFRAGRSDCFFVGLSGNLGFTHDPETVFAAARRLANNDRICFLLSGWGLGWERIKRLQQAERLPNIRLIERVPSAQLEDFLAVADVWIIPYRKHMAGVSVPSRFYNLLAVGRPIIALAEADAEHAMILSEHDVGWVVPPEDPDALAATICNAAADHAAVAAKGRRAVGIIGDRFTRAASGRAYRMLAQRLCRPVGSTLSA
ncbi:MAG: glycosyltransferase family 4 protein [Proteobacteria bacterium]|nr:glycosyltransferase family 4 protein [Pseudomonadota bacterium]